MEPRLSTFKEFDDHSEAEDAVRALTVAGFTHIEIDELSENLQSVSDVGNAPAKKVSFYIWTGLCGGLAGGFVLGVTVFGVPATLLHTPFPNVILAFGAVLCTIVGGIVGLEEGLIYAKRAHPDPTSSDGGSHRVGVCVRADNGHDLLRAKAILEQYGEHEWGEKILIWRMTHWVSS
jgi:hypothetical protein